MYLYAIGDILLAIPGEMTFLVGLVAFLIGHIFYIRGFQSIGRPTDGLKDFAMTYIPFAIYGLCVVLSAYTFSGKSVPRPRDLPCSEWTWCDDCPCYHL